MPSTSAVAPHREGGAPLAGAPPAPGDSRLLGAWHASGRADLRAHLEHHGLPPLPRRGDHQWSARLATAVDDAGLSGRGGGGFPTGVKLRLLQRARRRPLVVVNGMESEPESRKDAVLLRCAPHLVLDGAQLAAAAVGATQVTVCVADDRPDLAASVVAAVAARPRPLSPVAVDVARPPARYVASEESALVNWLARGTAVPTFRADKSVPLAVGRQPTLVHNAETLAHLALIARHGPAWFRQIGMPDAPGSFLVTVSGAVERPGVREVPLGMPLRDIVALASPTAPVAAMLVGGRGGAWVGADDLSIPFAPGPLRAHGAGVGAGVVRVLPVGACGVAELARLAGALAAESAGQCGPCVFGLPAIADDLQRLAAPGAGRDVLPRLQRRLAAVTGRGACRHPDGVARMVATGLEVFAPDVARHRAGAACRPRPATNGRLPGSRP